MQGRRFQRQGDALSGRQRARSIKRALGKLAAAADSIIWALRFMQPIGWAYMKKPPAIANQYPAIIALLVGDLAGKAGVTKAPAQGVKKVRRHIALQVFGKGAPGWRKGVAQQLQDTQRPGTADQKAAIAEDLGLLHNGNLIAIKGHSAVAAQIDIPSIDQPNDTGHGSSCCLSASTDAGSAAIPIGSYHSTGRKSSVPLA